MAGIRDKLFPHNLEALEAVEARLQKVDRTCVLNMCGTGKQFIGKALVEAHPGWRCLWVTTNWLVEQVQEDEVQKVCRGVDFKNLDATCYATLYADWTHAEDNPARFDAVFCPDSWDLIVLDEFQRAGASEHGRAVLALLNANPGAKVLGLSATSQRAGEEDADGDARDMAKELFGWDVAYRLPIDEAWGRGILPRPIVVEGIIEVPEEYKALLRQADSKREASVEIARNMADLKRRLHQATNLGEMFHDFLAGRESCAAIVFCDDVASLKALRAKAAEWFGPTFDDNVRTYPVYSDLPDALDIARRFSEDKEPGLKVLYVVDMANEGMHISDVDVAVFARQTASVRLATQQVGRVLHTGSKTQPVIGGAVKPRPSGRGYKAPGSRCA